MWVRRGAAAATCGAPSHVGAGRDRPGAALRGPRAAGIGWRRPAGIGHAATRASDIGWRGGVAMVTGRGGAGARPGSGVMAAAAGAALLMLLMAAALAGGDDSDWVRLPSKCEGKRGLGGPG